MSHRELRLGEELISPLHSLYDGLQVDGSPRPAHPASNHPVWVVTRYHDAKKVLSHAGVRRDAGQAAELYTRRTGLKRPEIGEALSNHMLNADPPDHTRLRALVGRAFTTRQVEKLQPHIERVTDELLDAIALRERADLMADFAVPLTIAVICELLGVPEAERDHVRSSWERQAELLSPADAKALADEQADYLRGLLEFKRRHSADDVFSCLVQAVHETGQLTEPELVAMAHLLLMSGFETTMNMIGNAMVTLLVNPDQLAVLRARPDLLPNAIEELVRHDSPVRASMLRFTVEDVELGEVTIPAGEYVLVSNLTANHDAEQFDDPDSLDLTRNADGHLGYGCGAHYCIGASLARLEGRIAIGRLLSRFPNLALAVPHTELRWLPITFLRALLSVPVLPGQSAPVSADFTVTEPIGRTSAMNAKDILLHSLQLLQSGDARGWCDLFHPDGVLEFPYAPPGWNTRFEGREAIWEHMRKFPENLTISFSEVTFHETADPDLAIGEFHGDGTGTVSSGKLAQDYISVLWIKDGQIVRYRDFWNPLRHLEALGGIEAAAKIVQG